MSVSSQEIVLDLAHIRLAGLQFGEGVPDIVALHGWLDNAESFRPLAEILCAQGHSILALDFAGHGHSGHRPLGSGYHFSDYLYDLRHALLALGIERIDFLCHSMGAAAGALFAAIYPEQVRRLMCIELYGVANISDKEPLPERFRVCLQELNYTLARPERVHQDIQTLIRARRQAGEMLPESAHLLLSRNTVKTAEGYRFLSDRRLRVWQPSLFSKAQMLSFIEKISAPVLVIEAEQGLMPHWDFLAQRYARTQDITVKRLAGGHHVHMDSPEPVAEIIRAFLAIRPSVAHCAQD